MGREWQYTVTTSIRAMNVQKEVPEGHWKIRNVREIILKFRSDHKIKALIF